MLVNGSSLRKECVSRPAPSGSDTASAGSSSQPVASSSEPPPMSMTNKSPLDQPNQRRAAKKVKRASSSPDKTLNSIPQFSLIWLITRSPFVASRIAEVAKVKISSV